MAAPRFPRLLLREGAQKRLARGHRWIFSNEVERLDPEAADGGEVAVFLPGGVFAGSALYSAHALIAARIYSRASAPFDGTYLKRALRTASAARTAFDARGDAYRIAHSEADALPGLIVDRYANVLVFQLLTKGLEHRRAAVIEALREVFAPAAIVERSDTPARELEGLPQRAELVHGALPPDLEVRIGALHFPVDPLHGQKTGMFLDMAGNWPRIAAHAKNEAVLDLFSHQGGWSLHALAAGAKHVTAIDSSAAALELFKRAANRNGFDGSRIRAVEADVFDFLRANSDRFATIVCDPPAFAKSRKHVDAALKGYRDVNRLAMKSLLPGGTLYSCSCSHHVDRLSFIDMLRMAARDAGRQFRVTDTPAQPADHAPLLGTPETEYLKVVELADLPDAGFLE